MQTPSTDPAPIRIDGPGPYYAVYYPATGAARIASKNSGGFTWLDRPALTLIHRLVQHLNEEDRHATR